jgi:hypothetical protein
MAISAALFHERRSSAPNFANCAGSEASRQICVPLQSVHRNISAAVQRPPIFVARISRRIGLANKCSPIASRCRVPAHEYFTHLRSVSLRGLFSGKDSGVHISRTSFGDIAPRSGDTSAGRGDPLEAGEVRLRDIVSLRCSF